LLNRGLAHGFVRAFGRIVRLNQRSHSGHTRNNKPGNFYHHTLLWNADAQERREL
jgi:hypothetical protein